MNRKTFAAFVGPSVAMMLLFIALPLAVVFTQSFQITKPVTERFEVETCTPGFLGQTCETKLKPNLSLMRQETAYRNRICWFGLLSKSPSTWRSSGSSCACELA